MPEHAPDMPSVLSQVLGRVPSPVESRLPHRVFQNILKDNSISWSDLAYDLGMSVHVMMRAIKGKRTMAPEKMARLGEVLSDPSQIKRRPLHLRDIEVKDRG